MYRDRLILMCVCNSLYSGKNTAAYRIQPIHFRITIIHPLRFALLQFNTRFLQPSFQLYKVNDGIHISAGAAVDFRFPLFGNAGTDKHLPHIVPQFLMQHLSVRHHRREHRRQIGSQCRMMQFYQFIGTGTASRNNIFHLTFLQKARIFLCYISSCF